MELYDIPKKIGKKKNKRVGRGRGSGVGKTCGRGSNGSKSRSGNKRKIGFEGGQIPLYLKIPKKGFNSKKDKKKVIINLISINKIKSKRVDVEQLNKDKLIKKKNKFYKDTRKRKLQEEKVN